MKVIWTRHALTRQMEWQRSLGITKEEIETLLADPDQIVPGDSGVLVAQKKRSQGLLRVPYLMSEAGPKILTVYWTSKIEKYWR